MKNIIITLCFALATGLAFGQIKVITNGNVGIGVPNPTSALEINGNTNSYGQYLTFGSGLSTVGQRAILRVGQGRAAKGTAEIAFYADTDNYPGGGAFFKRTANGLTSFTHQGIQPLNFVCNGLAPINFITNNIVRMAVKNSGDVGIGTAAPTAKLQVGGDIKASDFITVSDKRLKTDIKDFDLGLDQIMRINPYTYFYNGKADISSDLLHFGVLAQEFEEIVPEAVGDYLWEKVDEQGNVVDSETYKQVQTEAIKYMLVNAVKEQQALIEEQDERINKLEDLVRDLLADSDQSIDISGGDKSKAVLGDNYPNPFEMTTSINYFIPEWTKSAQLNFFDMSGKLIRTSNIENKGSGVIELSVSDIPSGIYNYQMVVDGNIIATKKMSVSK